VSTNVGVYRAIDLPIKPDILAGSGQLQSHRLKTYAAVVISKIPVADYRVVRGAWRFGLASTTGA
jgi:hypothetical protein